MESYAQTTKSIALEKYGILNTIAQHYNSSFEDLYNDELDPNLVGFEKGNFLNLVQ